MTCTEIIILTAELEEIQNNLITARNEFAESTEKQIKSFDGQIDKIESVLQKYLQGNSEGQQIHYSTECKGPREWLKDIRTTKKMTQKQVAEIAGITENYYSMIETGERGHPLPVGTAKKIAAAMGFEWELFYQVDTQSTA